MNGIDLTGRLFGKLLVVSFSYMKGESSYWFCRCDCGTEKIIRGSNMKRKYYPTVSCGCYHNEQIDKANKGSNSYNWKGGKSKEPYPLEWTEELRESIRNRDDRNASTPIVNTMTRKKNVNSTFITLMAIN